MLNRREFVVMASGAAALSFMPVSDVLASKEATEQVIMAFTGGVKPTESEDIYLELPEIAENGNTVPLSISIESPMTEDDYVMAVLIVANGNPNPDVSTFNFTPKSGYAEAATRIRLATTQDVFAVAKKSDGSYIQAQSLVKVTIGGCGG